MSRRNLKSRLAKLESQHGAGTLSPAAMKMLAAVYGKLHALFLPYRSHLQAWPEINRLRRGYLNQTIGLSATASGAKNWVAGHDARNELQAVGLAIAVKGSAETTGLILTPQGRAVAWAMCRELLPPIELSAVMVERLASLEPCRVRGSERWVSESRLFGLRCEGPTSGWQWLTDTMLEPAISGSVYSLADVQGRVFYRFLRPFEDLPHVPDIAVNPAAEAAYLAAWTPELARLRSLDSVDGEICNPLSGT